MLNKSLSKTNPLPLYQQLAKLIESCIYYGDFNDGDQLPTEKEFCEAYDISRVTVREAMNVLKRLELIETRRGAGVFIKKTQLLNRDLLGIHDFDLQIEASGLTNKVEIISFEKHYKSTYITSALQLPPGTPLLRVKRLRKASEKPLFIENIFLNATKFSDLQEQDFKSTKLFSEKLLQKYGISISEVTLILDPVLIDAKQAELLGVSELPAAGLMNERISYDESGLPVVMSQWLFSRNRCRHLLKIKAK